MGKRLTKFVLFHRRQIVKFMLAVSCPAHYVDNATQFFIFLHHPDQEADRVNIVLGIPKLCYRLYVAVHNRDRQTDKQTERVGAENNVLMIASGAVSLCVNVIRLFLRQLVGCSVRNTQTVRSSR